MIHRPLIVPIRTLAGNVVLAVGFAIAREAKPAVASLSKMGEQEGPSYFLELDHGAEDITVISGPTIVRSA